MKIVDYMLLNNIEFYLEHFEHLGDQYLTEFTDSMFWDRSCHYQNRTKVWTLEVPAIWGRS